MLQRNLVGAVLISCGAIFLYGCADTATTTTTTTTTITTTTGPVSVKKSPTYSYGPHQTGTNL